YVTTNGTGPNNETIQNAVTTANPGNTVNIEAGTFVEQVNVNQNLTLIGAGAGSTIIQSPAVLATSFNSGGVDFHAVVSFTNTTSGNIYDLTVDGNGQGGANNRMAGIAYHNAGGT